MNFKLLNKFFNNIDDFNTLGMKFIKNGDFEKARKTYELKIEYIIYAHEFEVISADTAFRMITDTKSLIRALL